jgi:hypothetical protein
VSGLTRAEIGQGDTVASFPVTRARTFQRSHESRFDHVQQQLVAIIELAPRAAAPDPQVAQCSVAIESVQVDSPVQAILRQEIVEELGAQELAARHHLADQGRVTLGLKQEGDRVAILVPVLVLSKVRRVHVQRNAVVKA